MTDGPRQRSSTAGSAKDGAAVKESGGGVALKKEIGLVSACGIIIGECHCCCVEMTCGDESLCWMSEGLRLYEKCVKMRIWQTGMGLSTAEKIRVYSHLLFSYEQGKKKLHWDQIPDLRNVVYKFMIMMIICVTLKAMQKCCQHIQ